MLRLKAGTAASLSVALAVWAVSPAVAAAAEAVNAPLRSDHATRTDFRRLSVAGAKAFDEVALARLAIFDGHPATAATLIGKAKTGFELAANDRTAFDKAEDALQPPPSMHQPAATSTSTGSAPTTWIPVAENFVVNETLAAPKDTATAVDRANASLKGNRREDAVETLKVAQISAIDTVTLAPLHASLADINRASQLAAAADYYGAGQALRALEDGVRYDAVDLTGQPASAAPARTASVDRAPAGDHVAQ